ncbi:MAG TPA: ATP synthase F0 subunit C [Chloroflexota bacterium]|jgi:F-type H+-transporting ATPase subunit c|nr:ATP synthase F0 subunit C [Chloroflexota bacterium]HEX2186333.1 ATP synthase F0 subunit C [Chloroflexota bacterium]
MEPEVARRLAAAAAIAIGGIGPAIGIGMGVRAALEAIGRNPEAENAVRTTMIIGCGLAEAIAIYCFVVALIIAFV